MAVHVSEEEFARDAARLLSELPVAPDTNGPFDYVLLQQARAEGATLLASDAKRRGHPLATYARPR